MRFYGPVNRVVYLPEGIWQDPTNYSGTPLYLGLALQEACRSNGIKFDVVEVPEMINTEPICALVDAYSDRASQSLDSEALWDNLNEVQRRTPASGVLRETLEKSPSAAASAVEVYVRALARLTQERLAPYVQPGTIILALNTLNPPASSVSSIYYYLDTPLVPFYFDQKMGIVPSRNKHPALCEVFKRQELAAIENAKGLFFFSRFAAELCEREYLGATKLTRVVGAGVNLPYWPEYVTRIPVKPLRLLFVGRNLTIKGGSMLLDAAARLSSEDFLLTIVTERCFHFADPPKTVRFLGPVDKSTLEQLYQNHDVFVFPTERDAFGLVVCEAMAFGCPVLATPVNAIPEMLGPISTVWNPYVTTTDDLVAKLQALAEKPSLIRMVGQKNRLTAQRQFRWPLVVNRMLELIAKDGLELPEKRD